VINQIQIGSSVPDTHTVEKPRYFLVFSSSRNPPNNFYDGVETLFTESLPFSSSCLCTISLGRPEIL